MKNQLSSKAKNINKSPFLLDPNKRCMGINNPSLLSIREVKAASRRFHRLLYYSPNTTGIGHESRAIALLTGLRHYLTTTEFLVVTSTSVPQQFLWHNLEIVRLPALVGKPTTDHLELAPRYLTKTKLSNVQGLRQSLLNSVFDNYRPDFVMVDHHPIGLDGEILPWLMRKRFSPEQFVTAYISRGVIAKSLFIQPPYVRIQRGVDVINVMDLYDHYYVLEQRERLNPEVLSSYTNADYADRVQFLDRVTIKSQDELLPANQVISLHQLPESRLVTASLGHNAVKEGLLEKIIQGFKLLNSSESLTLLVVLSPYLDTRTITRLESKYSSKRVMIRPYIQDFVDILNVSAVAICRAGYNTVAELELTGCPALIIPEDYGSQEQLIRANSLPEPTFSVMMPDAVSPEKIAKKLKCLLKQPHQQSYPINKYLVAERLIKDLLNTSLRKRT